ncbi:MAG: hypothetical protein SH856_13205 [Flavobacteriales bacterium]|nr:hypothetical protein [Flavobacteriales bacterium]
MKTRILLLVVALVCGIAVESVAQKQKKKPPKQENVRTPETAAEKDAANKGRIKQEYEDKLEKHRNLQDKPTQKRMKKTYKHAKDFGNEKPLPFYKRWFRKKKF